MRRLLGQFPDLSMRIEAIVAHGDLVVVRVLSTGTNLGRLNGVPRAAAPSAPSRATGSRLVDGRIAEHWATRDDLTSMLQLGVVTRPRLGTALRQTGSARSAGCARGLGVPDPRAAAPLRWGRRRRRR